MAVLLHTVQRIDASPTAPHSLLAARDLMIIAFFFLMRPGEYCNSSGQSHPFKIQDVQFYQESCLLNHMTASEQSLQHCSFITLTFTTQKNAVRGERVGHAPSGDPLMCPVQALVRRILHLRLNGAAPDSPIHHYYPAYRSRPLPVTAQTITNLLRQTVHLFPQLNLDVAKVSARSLRATGAMALLTANVDPIWVPLHGRWQSDTMIRYLHVEAQPILQNFSTAMLQRGTHHVLPTMFPTDGIIWIPP